MTTFAIMQARIADEIVRDDLALQIKNAINQAINTWEGERFAFNERRYLINTVNGQEYYDLISPTLLTFAGAAVGTGETVLEFDNITCTVNNMPYPLTGRTQQWFDRFTTLPTQYKGQPDSYTIYNNQLRIFPIPNAVFPLNISALARLSPNPLSDDADTNAWMTEGEPLIRQQSKFVIYRDVVRDADGKAAAAEGIQEAQWQLQRKMAGKLYTGTQRAWSL